MEASKTSKPFLEWLYSELARVRSTFGPKKKKKKKAKKEEEEEEK